MENQVGRSSCRRQRVVLFPLPFQGHINPMLQLANILYFNGFSITIIHTNFNSQYTSNYPQFTFRAVLDNDSKDNNLAKLSSKGIGDLLSGIMVLNQCSEESLRQELDQMLIASKQQQEPIVCLITDALWYFTQSVADSLKLPRMVLRTSSLFCVNVYASIPVLEDQGYFNQANSGKLSNSYAKMVINIRTNLMITLEYSFSTVFDEENIDLGLKNIISPNNERDFKKPEGTELVFGKKTNS